MSTDQTDFVRSARKLPGPRDWILDIYGSFVREFGGWIAVADLLELLESLDVSGPSARSALSRMKTQGELESESTGTSRGYRLTESAERWFIDGTARIMEGASDPQEGLWLIASFTVPEDERSVRYKIRSRLQALGFGQLAGGLMIAPAAILFETTRALDRAGLTKYVDLWKSAHVGSRPIQEIMKTAWDLPQIDAAYREYLVLASQLDEQPAATTDKESFLRYLRHINAWRELPFLDPELPHQHLPENWPAGEARSTFARISAELRPGAWRHFVRTATTQLQTAAAS